MLEKIITKLKSLANPKNVEGMARFGINPKNTLGISVWQVRDIAKIINKENDEETRHKLALSLWNTQIHEARLLAGFIDVPKLVSSQQMDNWVRDFDSWDICDQVCSNLYDKTPFAWDKITLWAKRDEEFARRAGFVVLTALSVHDKEASDEKFVSYFPLLKKYSTDERNFVKKAVNWAIRQIGKRNPTLNKKAIALSEELLKIDSKSARWIARDAIRELKNKKFK